MTVRELIAKLQALPEEQKDLPVASMDYDVLAYRPVRRVAALTGLERLCLGACYDVDDAKRDPSNPDNVKFVGLGVV